MKIVLLVLLFLVFVSIAIVIYLRYYYRHIVFKDMVYICKYFKNTISFNKNTIDQLMIDIEKNISTMTRNLFNYDIPNKSTFLTKDDLLEIVNFKKSLGKGNIDYEIHNINYYENEFEEKKNITKDLLNKDGKMYLKLIIAVGIAVCIILV